MATEQKQFDVPEEIALCPECASRLNLEVIEWETETGTPTEEGCYVGCNWEDEQLAEAEESGDFDFESHRCWQSEWQPVIDSVVKWARANVKIEVES